MCMCGGSKLLQNFDFSSKLMSGLKVLIHIQRFKRMSNSPLRSPFRLTAEVYIFWSMAYQFAE